MTSSDVVTAHTDAGMLALWCVDAFEGISDYDSWEERVDDRLAAVISAGDLVPVNIQSDGAFGVRIVVDPDGLTDRESTYAVVTSDPYLLVSRGGDVCLSGIESVGFAEDVPARVSLPEGRYAVRTTIVAWDDEPGARRPDGSPTSTALPDFLVHVAPATGEETFRVVEETFDPPSALD